MYRIIRKVYDKKSEIKFDNNKQLFAPYIPSEK